MRTLNASGFKRAGDCVRLLSKLFSNANVNEPVDSAKFIVAHAFNKKTISQCNPNLAISEAQKKSIQDMTSLRLLHLPIQYIIGEWDFSGLELSMKCPVFIPRPETEELVERILSLQSPEREIYFLEVGSGSGAISVALLSKLPKARCVAIDLNPAAAQLTRHNAARHDLLHRIEIINISFDDFVKRSKSMEFDFLVSNPPYIPTSDLSDLQKEVSLYEDVRALDGGADGMDTIRKIIQSSSDIVKNHGSVWLEMDTSHDKLLKDLFSKEQKLKLVDILNDFTGRPRFCHLKMQK